MSGVTHVTVGAADADTRIDRWFLRRYPHVSRGRVAKLLRTGQVRVDGGRVKPGDRLVAGQTVRVPPLPEPGAAPERRAPAPSQSDIDEIKARILHRDDEVIAIDKPAGLAVQGGTKTERHLDAMLDALRFGSDERPRLVHRLDRDTSGVLVLARTAAAARRLGRLFKARETEKLYWALVAGRPDEPEGTIDAPLAKRPGKGGERVEIDLDEGLPAQTEFRVVDAASDRAAWLELQPLTGRTHQLRAHCAAIGHPILGDGKYGGKQAFLDGGGLAKRLHLHARALVLPRAKGAPLRLEAPLPRDLRASWQFLGFDPDMAPGAGDEG